ncbi:MAG: hypothetical protein RBS89_03075 [Candidatus Delongbacteria bacterium]|nr:hypothetical protein [Candidatus Delongbacteria bacterium]
MKNQSESIFRPIFEKISLPVNEICQKCDAKFKIALLPWLVGSKYWDTKEKILFVGKPHRDPDLRQIIQFSNFQEKLIGSNSAFSSYTREICGNFYGNVDTSDYVSLTNVVKCTNVTGKQTNDTTTRLMADCCIKQNGVIFKEIETLKPKHIVFYTYSLFREYLRELPFAKKITNVTNENHSVSCGNKKIGWWDRRVDTDWGLVKILVTAHPERMNKQDFVKSITDWIKAD